MFSKQLATPALNESTTIRSLAVAFSENTISLLIDCKEVYKDEMEFNLSKLYLNMDEPVVKLLRERKYPLFVDRTVDGALARANCQKTSKQKGYRKMMKDSESSGYYNGMRNVLKNNRIKAIKKLKQPFIRVPKFQESDGFKLIAWIIECFFKAPSSFAL